MKHSIMTRNYSPTIDWRAAILFEPVLLNFEGVQSI